jgi:hypothetical protein
VQKELENSRVINRLKRMVERERDSRVKRERRQSWRERERGRRERMEE